ncbi:MAG: hypothetical protein IJG53_08625 [Eggerthellaceae bacterium]|nr:hypothetical protein [Eggerthellaceae bacterium]
MRTRQAWGLWAEDLLAQTALEAGERVGAGAVEVVREEARIPGLARRVGAGAVWSGILMLAAVALAVAVAVADPLGEETPAAPDDEAPEAAAEVPDAATGEPDSELTGTQEKPYSTLTPVDRSDNQVNTHQQPDSSFLYDTSLEDLAGADDYFEGQTVQIVGEVIGDGITEGFDRDHVWVTLASTTPGRHETVMVYMTAGQASIIDTWGAYGRTGTILQVRGVYHLACAEHQGLSDIHVDNVNRVEPGSRHPDVFAWRDFMPGAVGVLVAGILLLAFHVFRQRLR